jgi:hypothetical protein
MAREVSFLPDTEPAIAPRYGPRPTRYWTNCAGPSTVQKVFREVERNEINFEMEEELASEAREVRRDGGPSRVISN